MTHLQPAVDSSHSGAGAPPSPPTPTDPIEPPPLHFSDMDEGEKEEKEKEEEEKDRGKKKLALLFGFLDPPRLQPPKPILFLLVLVAWNKEEEESHFSSN